MRVALIQVPYDLGRADAGLGAGVSSLGAAVAQEIRPALGSIHELRLVEEHDRRNEIGASMAVIRMVATGVRNAIEAGAVPFVLAGNCNSSLGTVTGLGAEGLGIVWLDAHADFNTPDTTSSGFFDGMALTMLTGESWDALRDGLQVVPRECVVHVAARDFDPEEERRLDASDIVRVRPRDPLEPALDELAGRAASVYLHVDLDVLDPSEGRANWYAADGGLTLTEVEEAVREVGRRLSIKAAALTAYAPECDPERRIPLAAARIARCVVAAVDRTGVPA